MNMSMSVKDIKVRKIIKNILRHHLLGVCVCEQTGVGTTQTLVMTPVVFLTYVHGESASRDVDHRAVVEVGRELVRIQRGTHEDHLEVTSTFLKQAAQDDQ